MRLDDLLAQLQRIREIANRPRRQQWWRRLASDARDQAGADSEPGSPGGSAPRHGVCWSASPLKLVLEDTLHCRVGALIRRRAISSQPSWLLPEAGPPSPCDRAKGP